jgi:putative hemolysin
LLYLPSAWGSECGVYFRLFEDSSALGRILNKTTTAIATKIPSVRKINEAYVAAMEDKSSRDFFSKFLDQLGIGMKVQGRGLEGIPKSGPTIAIANHPYGFADGASMVSMVSMVSKVRPDVKVLMFDILAVEGLQDKIIPIKLLGNKAARLAANRKALAEARQWLADGHALVIFPSGSVASYAPGTKEVTEAVWRDGAARLAASTNATVVPVYIPGQNSRIFHELRQLNSLFGTSGLPAEIVKMEGETVTLHVGEAITPQTILAQGDKATEYMRAQHEQLKLEYLKLLEELK